MPNEIMWEAVDRVYDFLWLRGNRRKRKQDEYFSPWYPDNEYPITMAKMREQYDHRGRKKILDQG